jgi:hypothetical protein
MAMEKWSLASKNSGNVRLDKKGSSGQGFCSRQAVMWGTPDKSFFVLSAPLQPLQKVATRGFQPQHHVIREKKYRALGKARAAACPGGAYI